MVCDETSEPFRKSGSLMVIAVNRKAGPERRARGGLPDDVAVCLVRPDTGNDSCALAMASPNKETGPGCESECNSEGRQERR